MTPATSRGLLFGTAAESYERFRLGYPDEVVDRTLGFAGRPVEHAIEVGAGTGKATRAFASRGIEVTALEPDPDMFSVLQRETAGMRVDPVPCAFEEYDGARVDLVYAASSWHWTDAAGRWRRTADLLVEAGVVALFGGPMQLADPAVRVAVQDVCRPFLGDDDHRPPGMPTTDGWWHEDLVGSGLFTDVQEHLLVREVVLPAREFVGYVSTVSAYLQLPFDDLQDVLRRVAGVLPAQVRVDNSVRLLLARRC